MNNQYNKDGKKEGLWVKFTIMELYKKKETMLME